jgi:hypothetical protein
MVNSLGYLDHNLYEFDAAVLGAVVDTQSTGLDPSPALPIGEGGIRVWPNPATSSFTLAVDAEMIGTSYTFSDMTGRVIYSHVVEKDKTTLRLDGLTAGLYFLHINGMSYKLVKE